MFELGQGPNCWTKPSCIWRRDKELKPSAQEGLVARDGKKREGESREGRHWLEKGWGGLQACSLGALVSAIHISSKFFIYFTGS